MSVSSVRFVPGDGYETRPAIMLIGEAPGEQEDHEGRPFVGRSGSLIRGLISEILPEATVYVTNAVKVRPIDNRTPTDEEIESWRPLLWSEIRDIKPKLIITLGLSAAKAIHWKYSLTMKELRGSLFNAEQFDCLALNTYHPAYAMRKKEAKELLIKDLHVAKAVLDENT